MYVFIKMKEIILSYRHICHIVAFSLYFNTEWNNIFIVSLQQLQ